MASKTTSIPVLDFYGDGLEPGTPSWAQLSAEVGHAAREFGCFEALWPTSVADRQLLFPKIKEVFALPVETKRKNVYEDPLSGYNGPHRPFTNLESLGINGADSLQGVEDFTNVLWPQGNPDFSEAVYLFLKKLSEFGGIVSRMVLENLGVEKYHDGLMETLDCHVRMMHYKHPLNGVSRIEGLGAHADSNFLTILFQDEVNGLEVLNKQGQWIPVLPSPNSLIVIVGVTLVAWANERIHAPLHRVSMIGEKDRYSMALFMMSKAGKMVRTPEELVDEQHPLIFKPFDYFKFRRMYLSEFERFNLSNPSEACLAALKEYAGI
ncbi:2-oxoglutarate-dependent dioxygenase AOP2-like [Magnolia sinica]|uniref:2-oxoglutarate-dependent dioxygenase AOP2-like n=1 Tax=Magnolia sinica TaxID=86752 RepID=UPI00265B138E|nr:2-oxoglutarate-dependent dioxygenase AOP2-like [Magnolia sinica]